MSDRASTFPEASSNPGSLAEVCRAISTLQNAHKMVLPPGASLPDVAKSAFAQIAVVQGGTANGFTYVFDGTAWRVLFGSGGTSSSFIGAVSATPGLTVTGAILSQFAATSSQNGYLTSTDWATFNNKQAALTSTSNVTVGTLTAAKVIDSGLTSGRVTFATTGGQLTDSGSLTVSAGNLVAAGTQNAMTGVSNNTAAAAGQVGEVITDTVAAGSALAMTTGTMMNVSSITLTSGHWLVYGVVGFTPGVGCTTTYLQGGNSTTSATIGNLGSYFINPFAIATTTVDAVEPNPPTSFNVASGATMVVYLVAKAGFAVGTLSAYGTIEGRRMW